MHKPPKFDPSEKSEVIPPKRSVKYTQMPELSSQNSPGRDAQKSQNSPGREECIKPTEKIDSHYKGQSRFFIQQSTNTSTLWQTYYSQLQDRIQILIKTIEDKISIKEKGSKVKKYNNHLKQLEQLKTLYLEEPSEHMQFKAIENAHEALRIAVCVGDIKLVKLLLKMEVSVFSIDDQFALGFVPIQKAKTSDSITREENVLLLALNNRKPKLFKLVFEKAKTELESLEVKSKMKSRLWQLLLNEQPTEQIKKWLEAALSDEKPTSHCFPCYR